MLASAWANSAEADEMMTASTTMHGLEGRADWLEAGSIMTAQRILREAQETQAESAYAGKRIEVNP